VLGSGLAGAALPEMLVAWEADGARLPPSRGTGVTCGVDDKKMTACKDSQGWGFVLSSEWSGWIPKV
jgi:hypothetical protein